MPLVFGWETTGTIVFRRKLFEREGIDVEKYLASAALSQDWKIRLYSGDDLTLVQTYCQP
jgi:hypothetical protein